MDENTIVENVQEPQAPSASSTWSYTAPTVEQQSLDAGTVATDADGQIVPLGTQSEVETPEEPEEETGN